MKDYSKETAGYKFGGVVEEFDPMGEELKPSFEMELDLTNPEDVVKLQNYLKGLKEDLETKPFFNIKNRPMDKQRLRERAMKNPGDLYVTDNGKKVPFAKYLKNKSALNKRENMNFSKSDDNRFDKDNNNLKKNNPLNYQSMAFNTPKVGE